MKMAEALIRIINYYGYPNQHKKAIEECQELVEALHNHIMHMSKESLEHLIDEMADVRVMLEQLELMNGCRKEVADRMEYKIRRQLQRMEWEIKGND